MPGDYRKVETRRLFRSGHALVVAIPKAFALALHLQPGTDVTYQIRDRALIISRAVIAPEHNLAPGPIPAASAPSRTEDR